AAEDAFVRRPAEVELPARHPEEDRRREGHGEEHEREDDAPLHGWLRVTRLSVSRSMARTSMSRMSAKLRVPSVTISKSVGRWSPSTKTSNSPGAVVLSRRSSRRSWSSA